MTSAVGAVGDMAKITSGLSVRQVSMSVGRVREAGSTTVSARFSNGNMESILPR